MHARTPEALYPLALTLTKTVEPSLRTGIGARIYGKAGEWDTMSEELETSPAPIELIVASFGREIPKVEAGHQSRSYSDDGSVPYWVTEAEEKAYEIAALEESVGDDPPDWIPKHIRDEARRNRGSELWKDDDRELAGKMAHNLKNSYRDQIERAKRYRENPPVNSSKISKAEEEEIRLRNMTRAFNIFSNALNVSKIISNRHFADYKNQEEVDAKIQEMCDAELLMAYDDYTVDDAYVSRAFADVFFFVDIGGIDLDRLLEEEFRGLSEKALDNIKKWRSRQRNLMSRYKLQSAPRILLALQLYKEIERRNLQGGDFIADNINKEPRSMRYHELSTPEQLAMDRVKQEIEREYEEKLARGMAFERVDTSKKRVRLKRSENKNKHSGAGDRKGENSMFWHVDPETGRINRCLASTIDDCKYVKKHGKKAVKLHFDTFSEAQTAVEELFGKKFDALPRDSEYEFEPNPFSQYGDLDFMDEEEAREVLRTTDNPWIIRDVLDRKLLFTNDGSFILPTVANPNFPQERLDSYCEFPDNYVTAFVLYVYESGLLSPEQKQTMEQSTENETLKRFFDRYKKWGRYDDPADSLDEVVEPKEDKPQWREWQ